MKDITFTFAKITASPTDTSWSQVYNAGSLFALLSLTKNKNDEPELGSLGKEFFKTLEEEYFTLAERNLAAIKEAVEQAIAKIPQAHLTSVAVGAIIHDVLYVFLAGKGKTLLNRATRIGSILPPAEKAYELVNASGHVKDNDTLIFVTESFLQLVPTEEIQVALGSQTVQETAETLAPKIHQETAGDTSALFVKIHETPSYAVSDPYTKPQSVTTPEHVEDVKEPEIPHELPEPLPSTPSHYDPLPPPTEPEKKRKKLAFKLSHTRKLALSIALILLGILALSIFITIKKQQDAKTHALFESVYPQAQKKYDEGEVLLTLNKPLAQDSLTEAKKDLEADKDKFPVNSSEKQQVDSLIAKIDSALAQAGGEASQSSSVTKDTQPLLEAEKSQHAQAAAQGTSTFLITSDGVVMYANGATKPVIKKDETWVGLGAYTANVYTVDTKANQILKLAPSADGYGKTIYSTGSPIVSNAVSLTVDTNVWLLNTDGSVKKFLRGVEQSFTLTGYTKGFSKPTRIYTTIDSDKLYILDSGSGSVIVFGKDGNFLTTYAAPELKNASDIVADEKAGKLYFLSGGQIFSTQVK